MRHPGEPLPSTQPDPLPRVRLTGDVLLVSDDNASECARALQAILANMKTILDWTSRYPRIIQSRYVTLPGVSGFRWMPRKMAGMATITIDASIVAIVMLSVVLDRATHRYLSGRASAPGDPLGVPDVPFIWPESTLSRTLIECTPNHLLSGNC